MINGIISNIGFKTCKHESCLYYHPNYKGEEVYFIRQVDDFAISCKSKHLADEIIALIDQHMTIKVKPLGVITRFNDVDVYQTHHYIKVNNATYLNKILADKKCTNVPTHNLPLPMSEDSNYNREIESAAPLEDRELHQTEKKFGFTYRQGVGELIYAMVTCRPDISFPLIKLSQYSAQPAKLHFKAIQGIYNYLHHTIDDGLYYWRSTPRLDLKKGEIPICQRPNNYVP